MLRLKDNCSHSFSSEAGLILPTAISANTATVLSVRRYYVCDRAARNGIPSGPFPLPVSRWGALAVQASIAKRWQLVTSKSQPARGSRSEAVDKQQSTVEFFSMMAHVFIAFHVRPDEKKSISICCSNEGASKGYNSTGVPPACRQPYRLRRAQQRYHCGRGFAFKTMRRRTASWARLDWDWSREVGKQSSIVDTNLARFRDPIFTVRY